MTKIIETSSKNRQKILSFSAALLLHFLLFVLVFFSFTKITKQPDVTLEIALISPGELTQKKKTAEIIHLKKETHQASDHHHAESDEALGHITQNLDPIFHPLPQIPDDLRNEAFSSLALARFHIDSKGDVARVDLVKPCANPRLNVLLIQSLEKWKFPVGAENRTQEISVTFAVR